MILEHSQFKITKQINLWIETKLEFCSEKKIISRTCTTSHKVYQKKKLQWAQSNPIAKYLG
jgi:hypothetical protein